MEEGLLGNNCMRWLLAKILGKGGEGTYAGVEKEGGK